MTPLFFEHFLGKESCATPGEVRAVLAKSLDGYNEFIVADAPWVPGAGPYPYLSVLVKDRHAYLWYAPDDGSAGIQAYGPEDLGLDPDGSTAFHITPGGEVLEPHRHIAAADHAQAGGVPLDKPEAPQGAAAPLQQLRSQPLGLVLHTAAADGPQGPSAGKHRHQRPGPPGGGTAGLRHSHQLRRRVRLQGVDNLPHPFPHRSHPLSFFL